VTNVLVLRVLERVHGHLGWLSVAALLHPAILLKNPRRKAALSIGLATGFVTLTAVLGATFYPSYRALLKQRIFLEAPTIGWCFERKEHLAVGAVSFAFVGCLAYASRRWVADATARRTLERLTHLAFVAAFAFSLAVAVLGVVVASYKSF
jgi:hypothetical protein